MNNEPNSANDQHPESESPKAQSSNQGPLSLMRLRQMRASASSSSKKSKPNPAPQQDASADEHTKNADSANKTAAPAPSDKRNNPSDGEVTGTQPSATGVSTVSDQTREKSKAASKVAPPNLRNPLSEDMQAELDSVLGGADFDDLLVGDSTLQVGRRLEEGQRYPGTITKIHKEDVFVSLGGPDDGVVPLLHFNDMPKIGDSVDVIVRGFNHEDGLYELGIPGEAVAAVDWSDMDEGAVVEATVESANTGGLEAKVGAIRGFIPLSQISDYRVETPADFVGQKLLCVITESNPRRGNLVLSHRAVLEREKEEKRKERFAALEVGQVHKGTVRKVLDFGAFVDIGGVDGLIHVSQLSWERIKHPSEVVKEGDQIEARIEKIDHETGKIGLSYRELQDHPWENAETQFATGTIVKGKVSRIANYGAFVKLATGVEGLVHISELSFKRVSSVDSMLNEGDEVEVKVLTIDKQSQRIALSLRQAKAQPTDASEELPEPEEPQRKPAVAKRQGPLKGGFDRPTGGEGIGLRL